MVANTSLKLAHHIDFEVLSGKLMGDPVFMAVMMIFYSLFPGDKMSYATQVLHFILLCTMEKITSTSPEEPSENLLTRFQRSEYVEQVRTMGLYNVITHFIASFTPTIQDIVQEKIDIIIQEIQQ